MGTWQDGYVTDIPYTAGFYRELSPAYLHLLAILLGVRPPAVVDRQFAYCELGSGRGLGPLLLAATNPLGRFHGYDFNAAQMAKLQQLGVRAGLANLHFGGQSFADLAAQGGAADAAPRFDLIVLHGVYSWVSEENRRHIAHFIRDRLEPGGMVYVSYNCMPGWAAFTPMQRLLRELVMRRRGRSDENAVAGLQFLSELAARGARYFKADASIGRYLEHLADRDGSYLAHEYLNEHWDALYHLDVRREMAQAGLDYVGSAAASENIPALSASPELAAMFVGADPGMAETIKDFAVNRKFRRDLYVRQPVQLTAPQFIAALAAIRFTLTVDPERATTTLDTSAGTLTPDKAVVEPLLERLKQGSVGFAELASLPAFAQVPPLLIAQGLALLVESAQAHPLLEEESGVAWSASFALNDLLVEEARGGDDSMRFLAAPALGSGAFVTHSEQLLLSTLRQVGSDSVEAIRDATWAQFKAQDKCLVKDGRPLDGDADNLAELEPRVRTFLEHRLPLLRRLGVVAGPRDAAPSLSDTA